MLEVVLYALEMLEGVRRVLLCMPEAMEGELCLLEVLEATRGLLIDSGGCGGWALFVGGVGDAGSAGGAGGDVLRATPFAGRAGDDPLCARYSRCWRLCVE